MTHVRSEIPAKYKWDLTGIYKDEAAFEADYARAKELIADFSRHRDTMSKSAHGLYDALQASTDLDRVIKCQVHVRFAAKAVCTKIFAHNQCSFRAICPFAL